MKGYFFCLCHKTALVSELCESTEVKCRNYKIYLNKSMQTLLPDLPFHLFVPLVSFLSHIQDRYITLGIYLLLQSNQNPVFTTTKDYTIVNVTVINWIFLSFLCANGSSRTFLDIALIKPCTFFIEVMETSVSHRVNFVVLFLDFLDLFFWQLKTGCVVLDIFNVKCDNINGK